MVTKYRISLIHRHPWTRQAKVVISRRDGTRWQLVQSSNDAPTVDDAAIQRFLAWAKQRYPNALVREVKS
jgi:hypothetical protein